MFLFPPQLVLKWSVSAKNEYNLYMYISLYFYLNKTGLYLYMHILKEKTINLLFYGTPRLKSVMVLNKSGVKERLREKKGSLKYLLRMKIGGSF